MVVLAALALAGCPSALRWGESAPRTAGRTANTHIVQPGESLYAIGLLYDVAPADLARWNQLGDGELIFAGQRLVLRPPAGSAATPAATQNEPSPALIMFSWPTKGTVVNRFGSQSGIGKGIDIAGETGAPVFSAAAGRVVYSGDGLIGYGNLIIVKHSERFLSAYGYNKSLMVSEGEQVQAGQRIATMGTGPNQRPLLHFELRENGQPVDPLVHLPTR